MEETERELNKYIENRQAYSKAYENAKVYTSSQANEMAYIHDLDPQKVKFKSVRGIRKEDGLEFEISQFEVELPNGEKTIVTVDMDGNSMSCDFVDENGISQKFLLTPDEAQKILQGAMKGGMEGKLSTELLKEALFPASQEDMEKEIVKDTLVPENSEEAVKKIKEKDPRADVKAIVEEKDEEKEEADKNDDEEILLPENIRDKVSELREKEGCNLKHVLISKDPQSVADQLTETTGIQRNGEPVYCLSFRTGDVSTNNDRIVLIQGERVIDERKNDEPGSSFMNEYRNSKLVEKVEDNESKIYYTDIDGQTHSAELKSTPHDLNFLEKEQLEKELAEIDSKEEQLKSADMPLEDKIELLNKVNDERLDILDEYNIGAENVRGEIEADIEIGEDIQTDIKEEQEKEKNEDDSEKEIDEDDGYDPRDPRSNGDFNH